MSVIKTITNNQQKHIVLLYVAGITIKIVFHHCEISYIKDRFLKDFYDTLEGFIIEDSPKIQVQYTIEVIHIVDTPIITLGKKSPQSFKKEFTLSSERRKNIFTTYYYTSIHQFTTLLITIIQLDSQRTSYFIHASACNVNGGAYLFIGPSGAGKSTIVSLLSKKFPTLADDLVIIKKVSGEYYLYQLPKIEKNFVQFKDGRAYKLERVFRLIKSSENHIEIIKDTNLKIQYYLKQILVTEKSKSSTYRLVINHLKSMKHMVELQFSLNQQDVISTIQKD